MTPAQGHEGRHVSVEALRLLIGTLPTRQPITDAFETRHPLRTRPWYSSQKAHLIGWLGEYGQGGAYQRQRPGQDARHFYTHFQCAPGLLWLAEALGETPETLQQAVAAVEAAGPKGAAQCGALRRVIPWSRIEALLQTKGLTPS
ncbi:hypothetical protein [Deinococcus multiflagellatus]|uniref:Uncharacterized protein n=1 Tax=Deinococcus multiflagellatus TaxID=1656887 RepID=A0ABW1ZR50_9DEIO|nr:hypothetical protein [Deinococcus multiflagellatus]MBZ9715927.1 hypothetical protein [Deinococcus multiflagellatus]